MDPQQTDPVIKDLIVWLKENLPPDVEDEAIFKEVRKLQKVFDVLIGLAFKEFYDFAITSIKNDCPTVTTLEEAVSERLKDIKEYIALNEEKCMKTKKLNGSRAKLHLEKEQYELVKSIRLDRCKDLVSRYNHLISKK